MKYPCSKVIRQILEGAENSLFPEHFSCDKFDRIDLKKQIEISLAYSILDVKELKRLTEEIYNDIISLKGICLSDAQAGFEGDPAADSIDEVIIAYPGWYATLVHRIAHVFYLKGIQLIPRMLSEYAHSKTGIDIHPGATIAPSFFIDHGTGVVIGETAIIGEGVKVYQGVTLGALSTKGGQKLKNIKRHPTIENNVTIYANATILGGETIIGNNLTISGNAFITESVFNKK